MEEKFLNKNLIKNIDQIFGQKHILGKDGLIRKMLENKHYYSCLFYGEPGIGKTSLALAISNESKLKTYKFNPTINTKKDLTDILKNIEITDEEQVIIIIDEIHRMNKDKQDILLSKLENSKIVVFATTTENPYFIINPAIRSRMQIFELQKVDSDDIFIGIKKIISNLNINIRDQEIKLMTSKSGGDVRKVITWIDILNNLYQNKNINIDVINSIIGANISRGSNQGDQHYDTLSGFHKSLRGSDVDAALYYLGQLIIIGDIQSITRRIIAMAYEDIGLANPNLISRVILACQSAERVGLPEAKQIFSTIVIELCLSPKSNSAYLAINSVLLDLKNGLSFSPPNHIKDQSYSSASKLNRSGYLYPHDYRNNWVKQQYLPNKVKNKKYYKPSNNALENKMNEINENKKL